MGRYARQLGAARRVVILLALLGAWAPPALAAAPPDSRENPQWVELETRPGQGEQCLVCRKRIFDEDVVEIRYQGRTFHVGVPFFGDFKDDPERYFARLQARSALFDENAMRAPPMALGWLWLGLYVLTGLVFSAVCGYVAVSRSLSPIPWFFAGLLGNVAALVVLLFAPRGDPAVWPGGIPGGLRKVPTTRAPVACPQCASTNHPAAGRCSACGADLAPTVQSEAARVSQAAKELDSPP